ncbi:hypothetical protein EVG20_g5713 [Dentipellis fragilis]|uniref:Uncharacterized protein n=1 Tax=Dentipellis fragilis TaxID=205917 RepID=A0A4Y9YTJ7_9AGAM|nr:hypothetical protein EVG20_g5713 [Dentipellis fragilis]
MCLGNRAEVSAHYINSQLRALWENAEACVKKHDNGLKPIKSEMEYGFAFSKFYYGKHNRYQSSKDDLSFYASFGCPRLEFVCNHEAILYLTPKDGHFYVENSKNVHRASTEHKHSFHGYEVAFRLDFATHSVRNVSCSAIGNASSYNVDLLILDFASASFCDYLSDLPDLVTNKGSEFKSREVTALTHYLRQHYLSLLQRAGLHVLYSLPDFDNLARTPNIDYSIIANRALTTTDIFGISVADVNTFLRGLWLQAAAHIDEFGTGDDHAAFAAFYLAEHRSVWKEDGEDVHFHASFGPLQVQPLCKREVVLYMTIQDVHFYLGGFASEKKYDFSDWKIAVIVDVEIEESEQCAVRKLKLKLDTARFCEHLSTFATDFADRSLFVRLRSTLIRYMTTRYLTIIEESKHYYVYHKDTRIVHTHDEDSESSDAGSEEEEELGCWCEDAADCGHTYVHGHVYWGQVVRRMVTRSVALEADFATSVTQGALNKQWKLLWAQAAQKAEAFGVHAERSLKEVLSLCLADYIFERDGHVLFTASFGAPQVRLVCEPDSKKVILYFNLKEGYLKTLGADKSYDADGPEHHFSRWMIAFEVELKLRDCSKHRKVPEHVRKLLGNIDDRNYKQLVLDFTSTLLHPYLSPIEHKLTTTLHMYTQPSSSSTRSRRSPAWSTGTTSGSSASGAKRSCTTSPSTTSLPSPSRGSTCSTRFPFYAEKRTDADTLTLTDLAFQICPFTFGPHEHYVEGIRGRQRAIFDRNAIVFVGMTSGHTFPSPSPAFPRAGNWCAGLSRELSCGTVVLARRVFLEGKLLALLARINKETTGESKRGRECLFREAPLGADGKLEFVWSNRDRWSYEHEGDVENNGSYRVSCDTTNKLVLPTGTNNGTCAIKLTGSVVLKLAYEGPGQHWKSEASATWTSTITLSSGPAGVRVRVTSDFIVPDCSELHSSGLLTHSTFVDAAAELKAQLPAVLDIAHVVAELKGALEGAWPLLFAGHGAGSGTGSGALRVSNPTFNARGDLLLELQPYVEPAMCGLPPAVDVKVQNNTVVTGPNQNQNQSWIKKSQSFLPPQHYLTYVTDNGVCVRAVTTAVGEAVSVSTPAPASAALSPPPTYSTLTSATKTKTTVQGSYFNFASSEVSSPLVPAPAPISVANGKNNGHSTSNGNGHSASNGNGHSNDNGNGIGAAQDEVDE